MIIRMQRAGELRAAKIRRAGGSRDREGQAGETPALQGELGVVALGDGHAAAEAEGAGGDF